MNKILIFIFSILLVLNAHCKENPNIIIKKNTNGSLTLRIALKADGKISVDWGNNNIKNYDVNAATRIEDATMLTEDVNKNTEIRVYGNNIRLFSCQDQFVYSLDVKNARDLVTLSCARNYLKEIDLSRNKELRSFNCNSNRIKALDLSNNIKMTYLNCAYNYICDIALDKNTALQHINVSDNRLSSINLENKNALKYLAVSGNKLSALAVNHLNNLTYLDLSYNKFSACGLNQVFSDIPTLAEDKKSEKKNLIILHNGGFIRSNTALAVAKNWSPDTEGSGKVRCK